MQHLSSTCCGVLTGRRACGDGHDLSTGRHGLVSGPPIGYLADAPLGLYGSHSSDNRGSHLVDRYASYGRDARDIDDACHFNHRATDRGVCAHGDYDFRVTTRHFVRAPATPSRPEPGRDRSTCGGSGLLGLLGMRSGCPLQFLRGRGSSCRTSDLCDTRCSGPVLELCPRQLGDLLEYTYD
jgi:hypothetical protein